MFSGFMVIPYIAPTLVSNAGLNNHDLTYVYFIGGAATLMTRPIISRLTDTYVYANVFSWIVIISFIPVVLITQTYELPLALQLIVVALFFVFVSGRFIPCSALVTASCETHFRGRVMAFNSAMQSFGSGLAALAAGIIMVKTEAGDILRFDWVGYVSCFVGALSIIAARQVKAVS